MTPISVTYSSDCLRTLVEEYITMQKHDFTFKSLCSYVLYRAMEEEKTGNTGLYESNQLDAKDCERLSGILKKIIAEHRLTAASCDGDAFADNTLFIKDKE